MIQTELIRGGITCNKGDRKSLLFLPILGGIDIPTFAESYQVE